MCLGPFPKRRDLHMSLCLRLEGRGSLRLGGVRCVPLIRNWTSTKPATLESGRGAGTCQGRPRCHRVWGHPGFGLQVFAIMGPWGPVSCGGGSGSGLSFVLSPVQGISGGHHAGFCVDFRWRCRAMCNRVRSDLNH